MARPASPERDDTIRKIRNFVRESGVKEGIRLARDQFPSICYLGEVEAGGCR